MCQKSLPPYYRVSGVKRETFLVIFLSTVDDGYNVHGYSDQTVIVIKMAGTKTKTALMK